MPNPTEAAPNPAVIFETLNAYQKSAALKGAIELGLFTKIAEGSRTAAAIAESCGTDPRATRILCDFLVVNEFLTKQGNEYGLAPISAQFLVEGSRRYMGSIARFIHSHSLQSAFRDVAELVRRGETMLEGAGTIEDEFEGWVEFARSMVPLMIPPAEFIAHLVQQRKPGSIRVLDVAAGHGMFGIAIAKRNPQASIVALDWASVLDVAKEHAAAAGVDDRHALLPGNALELDYGNDFDVVLLTNILHHFDESTCRAIIAKAAAALNASGIILTLEFVPDENRVAPPQAASFSMTMLATTPKGDAYTLSEYEAMFEQFGLSENEMIDVPNSVQRLIVSRRAG